MSVTVTRTLRETDEDFIGGRVGWSHTTSLTVRICTPKRFSSGGLFFRTNVLRTPEGRYPGKRPKCNVRVMLCMYYKPNTDVQKKLFHFITLTCSCLASRG